MERKFCQCPPFLSVPPAGGCWARVVTVSPGPLIRVEGQPVSIRCDVHEYGGPREQVNAPATFLLLTMSHLRLNKKMSQLGISGDESLSEKMIAADDYIVFFLFFIF